MTTQERWIVFSSDEEDGIPSLSGIAVEDSPTKKQEKSGSGGSSSSSPEDFEFRVFPDGLLRKDSEEMADMCAADDVFFKGQILPLRPSDSRCGSMDRFSSTQFTTSRSASSNSSSGGSCISRSHSSSSYDGPRLSLSNNFYAHPSPTPQVRRAKKIAGATTAARKSTGSTPPGWGLIRLGVVKAPEIELFDARSRRSTAISRKSVEADRKQGKRDDTVVNVKEKRMLMRFGMGMGCQCAPDVVEGAAAGGGGGGSKTKGGGVRLKRGESTCRGRVFEWLENSKV